MEENPTVAQMRLHNEQKTKRAKAVTFLHSTLDDDVFIRISHLETAKEIWEKLEEEFFRNERTKQMQVLNLKREFEALEMNDAENIKDFMTRVMKVVNQIRLLRGKFPDNRIWRASGLVNTSEWWEHGVSRRAVKARTPLHRPPANRTLPGESLLLRVPELHLLQ